MSIAGKSDQDAATASWRGKPHGLSQRESDMLGLITEGFTNDEIAGRYSLSINSVKSYIRTAYRKIGVERRSQAVAWGYQNGFEPEDFRVSPTPREQGEEVR